MTNAQKQEYIIDNSDKVIEEQYDMTMNLEEGAYIGSVSTLPDGQFECVIYDQKNKMVDSFNATIE